MKRKWFAIVLSLLLVMLLAMPAHAWGNWGGSWGDENSGSSDPQIGEGHQKEFGASAQETEEETTEVTAVNTEPTETAHEETTVPETTAGSDMPFTPDTQEESAGETTVPSGTEEPVPTESSEEEESLGDRLFIRKVSHTEKWKLIVPAVGAAVSLAALILMKKKNQNGSASSTGYTTMSSWDDLDT